MNTYDMSPLRADWLLSAACLKRPDLPWTEDTDIVPEVAVDEMRAVCAGCIVRSLCGLYVDAEGVTGGFWAGADRDPELGEQAALFLLDGAA